MQDTPAYIIVAIKPAFERRARDGGIDDQGQAVEPHAAAGGEPLRDVMRRAEPGERILLGSYCPFERNGPYKEYGPIFILAAAGGAVPPVLPIGAAGAYFSRPFVLRAYSQDERIVDALITEPADAEANIAKLLARAEIAFILARFAAYGCYACRIERRQ
jgi:hypothetical protein